MDAIDIELPRFESVAVTYSQVSDSFCWSEEAIKNTTPEYRRSFENKLRLIINKRRNGKSAKISRMDG